MTTPERSVDTICQCRKGSMDDKQFRATVEYNIQSLLTAERQKREEVVEAERAEIIHEWNKAEQRLDGTEQGAVNAIEQFRNYLTK